MRRSLNVLYCHGLGCSPHAEAAKRVSQWVTDRGHQFTSLNYKNPGSTSVLWNVNEWKDDVLEAMDASPGHRNFLLVGSSAGCHPVLRSALQRPGQVAGLFLFCPGVGLDLTYIDRVIPGSLKKLRQGAEMIHPAVPGGNPALINLNSLETFAKNCVSHSMNTIPIQCPVSIVHGLVDKVVPFQNSIKLLTQLETKNRHLHLLDGRSHNLPVNRAIIEALETLFSEAEEYSNESLINATQTIQSAVRNTA
uniref:Hydrolase_4 domain-containing protein n=1 Tax=Steinernema glaseri TaxID=37863 RepID=A0A1I7ZZ15_9BILA